MASAIIVSRKVPAAGEIAALLSRCGYAEHEVINSGAEMRRQMLRRSADLLVINAPLTDEFGDDLARHAAENTDMGVLLLCRPEHAADMVNKVGPAGVLVLALPFERQNFVQALQMAGAVHNRLIKARRQTAQLQQKISEIKLVSRAKMVLMSYLNMSEPQAHRYIEKQAMDMRLPRSDVAQNILQMYET